MHIIGMAKSSLTLKGAKASKLELDFFKLAFAVAALRASGEEATGYLQVLAEPVRDRAIGWVNKYSTGDAVIVLFAVLNDMELAALAAEKARNALDLLSISDEQSAEESLSLALLGEKLGEETLAIAVKRRHPSVFRITDRQRFPQHIDWDFYGTVQ